MADSRIYFGIGVNGVSKAVNTYKEAEALIGKYWSLDNPPTAECLKIIEVLRQTHRIPPGWKLYRFRYDAPRMQYEYWLKHTDGTISAAQFITQEIVMAFSTESYEGGNSKYAFAVKTLAEGLEIAVDAGFITKEEAKAEFQANVSTLAERADKQREIDRLKAELRRLKAGA